MSVEFELVYAGGLRIHRGLTERELRAFEGSLDLKRRDAGTGWTWYGLPDVREDRFSLSVQVTVFEGQVRSVHLGLIRAGEEPDAFWDDWSEARERRRAEDVARWLRGRGCPPGAYPWGEVWAGFDPRSGFGSGGVNFTG